MADPRPAQLPSQRSAAPVFQARGVSKRYRMGETTVDALKDVDLDLFGGEFTVILGPWFSRWTRVGLRRIPAFVQATLSTFAGIRPPSAL